MFWRGKRLLGELDQQIRDHIEDETQDNIERGLSPDEARYAALRKFGSVTRTKEDARAVWIPVALEQLLQDLRFGSRILTRAPALSAAAVALIALVIGGNTTVFSIAHGIFRKPAPGVTSDRLVKLSWIDDKGRTERGTSYANYHDLATQSLTLRPMLGFETVVRFTLSDDNGSYALHGNLISQNYFETAGVGFVKGRSFNGEENELGASGLSVVISDQAWHVYFQGRDDIVGHTLKLNGLPATVVGVVESPFRGTLLGPAPDVWAPLVAYKRAAGDGTELLKRLDYTVVVNGRLAPGTTIGLAQAEMVGRWSGLQTQYPELRHLKIMVAPYSVTAGMGGLVDERSDAFLFLFSIVTIITLLIVCANVANLLLSRAVVRQREMALRQALGASSLRVIRALLAEGLSLAAAAWLGACLFAWWSSTAVRRYLISKVSIADDAVTIPDLTPDWTVLGYALLLAALATVACTVAPTLRVWRQPLLPSLKGGEQTVVQGRSTLSNGLVVCQLALAVLLVTCAGLVYRSMVMIATESGFDTRNLLRIAISTAGSANSPAANAALLDTLRNELQSVPGVERVSYIRARAGTWNVRTDGSAKLERVRRRYVGPGYLQVLGVPVLEGRALSSDDNSRTIPSAVVTRQLADLLWPGQAALGRTLQFSDVNAEVVGIVRDFDRFRPQDPGLVLLSAQQLPAEPAEEDSLLVVRYGGTLETIGPALRRRLQQADDGTSIVSMRTWDEQLESGRWPITALTTLLVCFAGGSLLIAAIGQCAIVTFNMRRRIREFGVRMALGASPRQVLTAVVREGLQLTAVGLAIGFALSLATSKLLGGVLEGVTPTDPLTYGGVFALLSILSLLACYLPARRTAGIDPVAVLRHE